MFNRGEMRTVRERGDGERGEEMEVEEAERGEGIEGKMGSYLNQYAEQTRINVSVWSLLSRRASPKPSISEARTARAP